MRFGDLPPWSVELSTLVHECICVGDTNVGIGQGWMNEDEDACPLPSDLLWREPLFDQLIANRYKPGEVRTVILLNKFGALCSTSSIQNSTRIRTTLLQFTSTNTILQVKQAECIFSIHVIY